MRFEHNNSKYCGLYFQKKKNIVDYGMISQNMKCIGQS